MTHNVYVIELDPGVRSVRAFANANPDARPDLPCVYVGLTGLTPEERFAKHKAGTRSSRYVKRYGLRLLPELFSPLNPMTYEKASEMEKFVPSKTAVIQKSGVRLLIDRIENKLGL